MGSTGRPPCETGYGRHARLRSSVLRERRECFDDAPPCSLSLSFSG